VLKVTSGGSEGYEGGKEIWKRRIAGAYGPRLSLHLSLQSWNRVGGEW